MIRGLYTSGWSMLANNKKMDVISNNLANVSTNGYKKDGVVFESFPSLLVRRIKDTPSPSNPSGVIGDMSFSSDVGEVYTYYNQGHLFKTDNSFDMAISGADNAFFTIEVEGPDGSVREMYTRDGAFVLDPYGRLVTKDGNTVLGEDGPIFLENGNFTVEADGTIIQDGNIIGRLLIRQFPDTGNLRKYGNNLLEAVGDAQLEDFTGTVYCGFLEQSNVDVIREMIDMITVIRSYEANQKMVQAQDSMLEKAVNEVGLAR